MQDCASHCRLALSCAECLLLSPPSLHPSLHAPATALSTRRMWRVLRSETSNHKVLGRRETSNDEVSGESKVCQHNWTYVHIIIMMALLLSGAWGRLAASSGLQGPGGALLARKPSRGTCLWKATTALCGGPGGHNVHASPCSILGSPPSARSSPSSP